MLFQNTLSMQPEYKEHEHDAEVGAGQGGRVCNDHESMMQRRGQSSGVGFAMAAQLRIAPGGLGFGVDGFGAVWGQGWGCVGIVLMCVMAY